MAKRKKSITKAALLKFQERLSNAPKKEKVAFSPSEVVEASREQIRDALAKGYSYEDIAEFLADGTEDSITANTLASYFRAPDSGEKQAKKKTSVKVKRKSDTSSSEEIHIIPKPVGADVADDSSGSSEVEMRASDHVSEAPAVAPEDMDDAWEDTTAAYAGTTSPDMSDTDLGSTDADAPQTDQGAEDAHVRSGVNTSDTLNSNTPVDPKNAKAADKQELRNAFNRLKASGRRGR